MEFDVVEILKTGINGFALLLLWLGYRLTSDVQGKIQEMQGQIVGVDMGNVATKKLETLERIANRQLTQTHYFLGVSILFLLVGVGAQLHRPVADVWVSVAPWDEKFETRVFTQRTEIELDNNGTSSIRLRSDENIRFNNESLVYALRESELARKKSQTGERLLATAAVAERDDAGFGF